MDWYWLGAFILNDVLIGFSFYVLYNTTKSHWWGADAKVLHCNKCGHPEVVPIDITEISDCIYCTDTYCENCETEHKNEDLGYIPNKRIQSKKILKSSVKK
jgi:hypothetical protein